ncbi:MAG: hypothetical protein EOO07_27760, partial [Chitinophagaceae bacterium]
MDNKVLNAEMSKAIWIILPFIWTISPIILPAQTGKSKFQICKCDPEFSQESSVKGYLEVGDEIGDNGYKIFNQRSDSSVRFLFTLFHFKESLQIKMKGKKTNYLFFSSYLKKSNMADFTITAQLDSTAYN